MQESALLNALQDLANSGDEQTLLDNLCLHLLQQGFVFDHLVILTQQEEWPVLKTLLTTSEVFQQTVWPLKEAFLEAHNDGVSVVNQADQALFIHIQSAPVIKATRHLLLVGVRNYQRTAVFMFVRQKDQPFTEQDRARFGDLHALYSHCLLQADYFINTSRLVEERTRKLTESESRFKAYAQLSSDWFWQSDEELNYELVGSPDDHTRKHYKMFEGRSFMDLRSERELHQQKKWHFFLHMTNRHKPFKNFEFEVDAEDNQTAWLSISGQPTFDAYGIFKGYVGTARDITYRKQTEREASYSKELAEQANAAKSKFIAMMSHELRTPLNVMLGNIELLQNTNLDDEQRSMLAFSKTSSQLLLAIISDVLDFSLIEANSLQVIKKPVNPKVLLNDVVQQFRPQAESKGLALTVNLQPVLPELICIDAIRTSQVLFNLLANAIKFTDSGNVTVSMEIVHQKITFHVQDSGTGIEPDRQHSIFQPFEKLEVADLRKSEGTGLGLSISQRLVQLMGGDIRFSSKVGKGTTFSFYIPFEEVDADQAEDIEKQAKASVKPLNVLVAEDHAANQLLMKAMLNQRGHSVVLAENGEKAVNAVEQGDFDIVLMDMMMPVLNGVDATLEIRKVKTQKRLPIIALTANVSLEDRQACLRAGMNDFLTKPLSGEALDNALRKWSS